MTCRFPDVFRGCLRWQYCLLWGVLVCALAALDTDATLLPGNLLRCACSEPTRLRVPKSDGCTKTAPNEKQELATDADVVPATAGDDRESDAAFARGAAGRFDGLLQGPMNGSKQSDSSRFCRRSSMTERASGDCY